MTISLGRYQQPFAGASGKAQTQAGPPSATARYRRRSHRGRYHTDRQRGSALQNTAICPAGPPSRSRGCGQRAHYPANGKPELPAELRLHRCGVAVEDVAAILNRWDEP